MNKLNDIFNHPEMKKPEDDPGLYDWKRIIHTKNDASYLNSLLKKGRPKKKNGAYSTGSHAGPSWNLNDRKQRVTFIMSYGKSASKHSHYIKMYMPQNGKEGIETNPDYFGCNFDEYESNLVPLHFKLIISPESQNIDLELYSKTFIRHLENLTGYNFYWLGCIHKDTDHKHIHISINGIDKKGLNVRFPKNMIKSTIRNSLSDIATNMIGERSLEEIQASKNRLPYLRRWTALDEKLKNIQGEIYPEKLEQHLVNRIQFLSYIGLAKKQDAAYVLKENFEEVLKATGRYNLYLEEYLKSDLPLRLFEGGNITGKVDKVISFDKDESWNDAVIIRTETERIYIPVFQLHKENLEGSTVYIDNAKGGMNRSVSNRDIRIISPTRNNDHSY